MKAIVNINNFKLEKIRYLTHYRPDKGLKGTIVNRVFPSKYGGLLEITTTVPLKRKNIEKNSFLTK